MSVLANAKDHGIIAEHADWDIVTVRFPEKSPKTLMVEGKATQEKRDALAMRRAQESEDLQRVSNQIGRWLPILMLLFMLQKFVAKANGTSLDLSVEGFTVINI